ncbi:TetR family transcriptional regulator [Streptomyces sp. NPDC048636]|uniref:TetR/AcrR family transcriptional regulator n=1 Tax=Streptomyces sp. NPDC048636 TaxID=3155762 RepID=UPI0034406169
MSSEARRGRYVEARRNDVLLLSAAREVFAEQGAGAPVSEIAKRAGIGMGSLYRRYGSKVELLQHLCTVAMEQTIADLDKALACPGSAWNALGDFIRAAVEARAGAFSAFAGVLPITPEIEAVNERGRERLETLLARGHADGSVRRDLGWLDVTLLIVHFSKHPRTTDDDRNTCWRLLAMSLEGLRARDDQAALPGKAPDPVRYLAPWKV